MQLWIKTVSLQWKYFWTEVFNIFLKFFFFKVFKGTYFTLETHMQTPLPETFRLISKWNVFAFTYATMNAEWKNTRTEACQHLTLTSMNAERYLSVFWCVCLHFILDVAINDLNVVEIHHFASLLARKIHTFCMLSIMICVEFQLKLIRL